MNKSDYNFEDERYPATVMLPMDMPKADAGNIIEYRIPGDDPKTVRLHSITPTGTSTRIATNIPVAGVSFRMESVMNFCYGYKRNIVLVAEPKNKYDPNAIAVHGTFRDKEGLPFSTHIGYVPKGLAAKLNADGVRAQLKIIYLATLAEGPGLRMDLWEAGETPLIAGDDDDSPWAHGTNWDG